MLLNSLRLLTQTLSQRHVANSPRHLLLQTEMSKQVAMLREVNESIAAMSTQQQIILSFRDRFAAQAITDSIKDRGEKTALTNSANNALEKIENEKTVYLKNRTSIMSTMHGILTHIREECAGTAQAPVIHAIEAPKAGKR
jgi:hypothetical protein